MQTLQVFRHAKTEVWTPGCEDFARRLQPRGIKEARRMASWICDHIELPEQILCSTSQRTRETLVPLLSMKPELEAVTHFLPQVYLADLRTLQTLLDASFAEHDRVMLVGHNPGLEVLIGNAIARQYYSKFERLPTGTLAVIEFESGWPDDQGKGILQHLVRAKHLPAN